MTSTNDGKDVKSNQTSGHKSKSYYIELYTSLEKALSGDGSLEERTAHVCEAWRRVYSLYQHSATATHPHLLSWLQRHTANTVLQSKWAKSKNEQARLTNAIDALVAEATAAAAGREQYPWEKLLLQRAAWFRKAVENPWDNPVLKSLINPNSEPVTDEQVLEWLISEHGIVLVTRLQRMVGAGNCDDLALLLASAVMDRARAACPHRPDDRADETVEEENPMSFVSVLEREASFTADEWEMLTDIELVLLLKTDKRPRCIELAKLTPLRHGYKMVERLRKRLEMSPRDKKLWKHAKEVATLVAQVVIARCMVLSLCAGAARDALYWCARALARLVAGGGLRAVSTALAAPAATARHLHTFCAALSAECKELKTDVIMKPFICELYVRAITAGMNELEQLKLNAEKASEARSYEQTLAGWFTQLGGRLTDSARLRAECALTAFSVHPARKHYERVAGTPPPPRLLAAQEPTPETTSEYGSWANDSRTQSNLVKTSETLQLKQSQQHQANVLSTAILTEGEALGLETELCQDLAVLLSGPRVKTLSWDMDREVLLENCRAYMEKTHGGTRAVTTELKYLNLDPDAYRHLPEEGDDESDVFYGIEKGYEHEVQLEEPEDIWQNAFFDPEQTESANDSEVDRQTKKKTKGVSSEDDEDPLSNIAEAKREKKKLAKEKRKERRKKSHKQDDNKDGSRERRKDKDKKTKKERKKDKSEQPTGSLTSLLGMKVTKMSAQLQDGEKRVRKKKERRREPTTMFSYVSVTDSDYDSQGKSSQVSEQDSNVLLDGVFPMDDLRSPERTVDNQKPIDNTNILKNSATVQSPVINDIKPRPMSSLLVSKARADSGISRVKSPYLTPNHMGPRHVVSSKVKSSITKLLEFRRKKPDLPRPSRSHTPTTPTHSLVGMKIYNPGEVPKVYLSRKQGKQLEALSKEVHDLFNEASSSTAARLDKRETDNLQNQNLYNVQKYQQQNSNQHHMPQNIYNESQKHSEYTQHSPIRPAVQNVPSRSPSIHTNYSSPIKTPEHVRTHALNLTPPKPTMTYQPFHKSMQNLSTDTKYDQPKKPQLINDPNYFSQQHPKSNSSQLSPRIISNTCIKPPSQTPSNVQKYSATVKDNITKSPQTCSNSHPTYTPRGPAQTSSQITDSKNVIRYGQKQLSSSLQNISEVPGRYDAIKSHIATSNMQQGQAAKPYSGISHSDASNATQALYNNDTSTASRSLPIQHREKVDKTPQKPSIKDNFDEYLKELVKSMSASNGHDRNLTIGLNKDVKVTPVASTAPAKRVDSVTPQCAKQLIQQKRAENAPNTFSRRSYMHKNKQSENKVNLTDAITMELNRTMMDHKFSKAKCMKNEVTISRVGPNAPDTGNAIRKLEQPCSRLQKNCPVLTSMLDSPGKPKTQTVNNTAISNTSVNQVNREDADLLLLLRNQAILKPNISNIALPNDATSSQVLNNSQITDAQISAAHLGLVGTKVKNINILDNSSLVKKESEDDKSLEWRSVMDAIIAQKTEPLGPNALDLVLKKGYRRTSQNSARSHSNDKQRVSGQSSSYIKPLETKKREYHSLKASSPRKPNTEKHSEVPKKPREPVPNNNTNTNTNKHGSPTIPKTVPQSPVIPNSDFDILDDLIDDDLRRELGEISSDEDTYSAPNTALLKGKTHSNIPKTVTNVCKAANISKEKPHIVNPKTTLPKNETNQNIVECNRRFAVNTCPVPGYPNVINNSRHPTCIESKPIAKPEPARKHTAASTIITNQVAQDTANNIVTSRIGPNQFMSNVIPGNVIIASVPQSPVVVIRQDLVYDPYPTIRIHESHVNAELCTVNENMYALNSTPNIAVYQTTQYAAPVINPIIIGNAMTTTNVSNATAMGIEHDTPDCTKDVNKRGQNCISLEDAIRLTDVRDQTPEISKNVDFNMNRNSERKVLSQVQEKHPNDNEEKDSHLKKLPVDDRPFQTDEDRIKLKRQSLMNREISHAGYHPPIPLTYTPLTKIEKQLQQETPKNGIVKQNLKSIPNSTSDIEKSVVISTSVKNPQPEANNENIESTDQASSAKENQIKCRRIWLRSSNKILNKMSPVKRPRVPLKRNKIKLKVSHNVIEKNPNVESENNDSVKNPTRVSNRILNRIKVNESAANTPPNEETTQQNVAESHELIDFEEALSGSIVLKTPTTNLGTENTSKQESECNNFTTDEKLDSVKSSDTVVEEHKNLISIEDTKVASASNRLEPMVVIEKLKNKLGDQFIVKSSLVKTTAKKGKFILIKKQNRAELRNKSIIKKRDSPKEATLNKIILKAPKTNASAGIGSTVSDNTNKMKSVVVIDQKVIKAAAIGSPLVRVETNKLIDQKVIEHASALGLPIRLDENIKAKRASDDDEPNETSKLELPVSNQTNIKQITDDKSQPVIDSQVKPIAKDHVKVNDTTAVSTVLGLDKTSKMPTLLDDQKVIKQTTASGLLAIVDKTDTLKLTVVDNRIEMPTSVDDEKVIKQTTTSGLPVIIDKTDTLKSTVVDNRIELPALVDDQKVIRQTTTSGLPVIVDKTDTLRSTVVDNRSEMRTLVDDQKVIRQPTTSGLPVIVDKTDTLRSTVMDNRSEMPTSVDDQKVIKHTTSSGLPAVVAKTDTSKSTVVDNRSEMPTSVDDQKVIKHTTSSGLPAVVAKTDTSKSTVVDNRSEMPTSVDDQKVIKHTTSSGLPAVVAKTDTLKSTVVDNRSEMPTSVDDQKVTKHTTSSGLPDVVAKTDTLKSTAVDNWSEMPTAVHDQKVIKHTTSSGLPAVVAKTDTLKSTAVDNWSEMPTSVDDQKVIKQTIASGLPAIVDHTHTLKSTIVDIVKQTFAGDLQSDFNETNKLKPRALDGQVIKPTGSTPQSVSTTVQEKHDNDATNCNKASSELEVKNNQTQTLTTTTASLENQKPIRLAKTNPDKVTNKATMLVKSKRSVILMNSENSSKPNAVSTNLNKTGSKPTVKLSPQMNQNHVPIIHNNIKEIIHISGIDDMQSTTKVVKSNSNDDIKNIDRQIVTGKSLSREYRAGVLNDEDAPKSDIVQEKQNVHQKNLQEPLNVNHNPNANLKRYEELKALASENARRPNLTDRNKAKQTHIKGDIKIEEIPIVNNKEPHKKLVRISLPNGNVFRATIHGKMQGDFNSLFADPTMRSILSGSRNNGKRYTVNYKQVEHSNKILGTQIKNLNIKEVGPREPIDTVNLISDDEDEVPTLPSRRFTTEFGKYNTDVDEETFSMHQKKFNQKCEVKMCRDDVFKSNKTKPKRNVPSGITSLLTRNKSKLLSNTNAPVVVNTTSNIKPEVDANTNVSTHAQETPIHTLEQANSSPEINPTVIEIDDSSNDSIESLTPNTVDEINLEPVKKLVELKSLLLHDLGVETDKSITLPIPKEKAVDNLKSALLQDLGIVTTEDPVIDITADDEKEDGILTNSQKQKECLEKDQVDNITQYEEKKRQTSTGILAQTKGFGDNPAGDIIQNEESNKKMLTKREERDNIKKSVVRLVKCDNLIKKYERIKAMKKCYVKIERLDKSILKPAIPSLNPETNNESDDIEDTNRTDEINQDNAEDFIEFDVEEPSGSPQLSRCPSLSILNNWDDDSQPLEIPYPTSPVMEIYDTIVELRIKQKIEVLRDHEKPLPLTCDSEWTVTKFGYRIEEMLLRSSDLPSLENNIVPDFDNLIASGTDKHFIPFDAPKLLTITLKFLEDNPDVISMRTLRRIPTKASPNKLKRKTEELVSDSAASKILKLGTLALNSLNSCIEVLGGIRFPDIEENIIVQADASSNIESSNRVLIESLPKYMTMTVHNIECHKQFDGSMSTLDIENSYAEKMQTDLAEFEDNVYSSRTTEVAPVNDDTNSYLEETTLTANSNESMVGNKTEDAYKKEPLDTHSSQPENNITDMCAHCDNNKKYPSPNLAVAREKTVSIADSNKKSPIDQVEEKCKAEALDSSSKPGESTTDLHAQSGNYEECVRPKVNVALINEEPNANAKETVPIVNSITSHTDDITDENYKGVSQNCNTSYPEKTILDHYAQCEINKECLTPPISVPLVNENNKAYSEETIQIDDSDRSLTDDKTEEKASEEIQDYGNTTDDIAKEQSELSHGESDLVTEEFEEIKTDENTNTLVNTHLSVEKPMSCLPSKSYPCAKNVTDNDHKVVSPLSNITEADDTESQSNVNIGTENSAIETPNTPVNTYLSVEKPMACLPSESYPCAKEVTHDHKVDSLLSNSTEADDTESQSNANISNEDSAAEITNTPVNTCLSVEKSMSCLPSESYSNAKNVTDDDHKIDSPLSNSTEADNTESQSNVNISNEDSATETTNTPVNTYLSIEKPKSCLPSESYPCANNVTDENHKVNPPLSNSTEADDIESQSNVNISNEDSATETTNTPVNTYLSIEKPKSCLPSESYPCANNVTDENHKVNSPLSNSTEADDIESQSNVNISNENSATEISHIDNNARLNEILIDEISTDLYEVEVGDTHIDGGIDIVETLHEKSQEPITVTNVHPSEVNHQDSLIKSPVFIDSKKIAFNYHDYTKRPKKKENFTTSSIHCREVCEVNDYKNLSTKECASETEDNSTLLVESPENLRCEDTLTNSSKVNKSEKGLFKSNPECKYELIQEDDLLTVKITTEIEKDHNEAKTIFLGPNAAEEETAASLGSNDAEDVSDIKGFEFEDVYVFPLIQSASNSNNTSSDSLGEELNTESIHSAAQNDLHDIDFHVIEPEITYSRKRKICMRDVRVPAKKYRKGKNIDCSKQTVISMAELAYGKEYKRLLEYCSSVKFSYTRPFHKECVEVDDLMSNWPINNASCDVPGDVGEDHLFVDLQDACNYQPDPLTQTLVEEINYEYDKTDATPENPSSQASAVNFNMGFGEGSGRVIQILKKRESNISAATLSDVKQSQPVLMSVDLNDCNDVTTTEDDQIKKIRQHVNFIELRDKVRTFFKKSIVELKSDWLQKTKDIDFESRCNDRFSSEEFPFDLCSLDYVKPLPINAIVQVVQVGQLPVSAAAQNPVTCDPRVTQVSDASPSQCSVDNSPNDDSQSEIKTEYTELTTADLTLPLQEYAQQNQANLASNDSNLEFTEQTISLEMEIKAEESPEIKEEMPDIKEEKSNSSDTDLQALTNTTPENMDYSFESNTAKSDASSVAYDSSEQNSCETFSQPRQQNGTAEKTDQIAHAMNAAGITTTPETVTSTRAHALVNILSQKIRQGSVNTAQTTTNTYSKTTSINAMALQQALAQILPPPLNQTSSSENNQAQSTPVGPQVLHIVQGKNASGNQITLVDNSQQSVISTPNATQVLHIVQNKNATPGQASNGTLTPQANSFSGLSLVDAGLQQGGNQLLHIVNTGNQKTASPGQLLKRVNLLTNLTNVQGSNEQKMVQFVCKSADGKAIQLNAPHQRGMVLRLQPIETPNVQTPPAKPAESQEPSPSPTGSASSKESASQQEIKSRSIYEENYAKFIQNSSSKTPGLEKSTSLPKFNQAFGKPVFQEGQKQSETASNNSHLPPVNTNTENAEYPANDNAINLEHIGQISSPPLLLRKQPVVTTVSQPNIVQQIKQTIAPMNIQTMHGGVIYTRQIPVNIGGGQTINLITVPSTELINDDSSKTQAQTNQGEIEPSIIKIVPQSQTTNNTESSQEESNNHASGSNENAQTPQPQPVLTQMRIKLPMLSKAPQMVPGARVVRPSFFQIQRNVIGGANQPVYQQLVLTAAPPLGQQAIRLPQAQASRPVKTPSESQSSSESQMSTSTLEQLREFDMVLEQVKERSTVQPSTNTNNSSFKIHTSSSDTTDGNASSNCSTESTSQVLYSIGNNQSLNVAYVNRKTTVTTPTTSTYVRSPDSSGIADSPTSSTHVQIPHTVTTDSSPTEMSSQSKPAKVGSKSKSRPKSTSNPPNTLKLNSVPPKTSSQKPLEDEQTTQRILYILAEYKEQVENSPDKDKPAPRRRSNPPSNPGSSKRKKSSSSRRSGTRDMSPVHGEDTCRTMGSEDSSCGTSQGDCTESCLDSHSPQDSPRKVARKITFDQDITVTQPRPQPQRNVIVADGQTITVARGATGKPATAVLMPANYILPVSMVKGGQQIAIVTNRGPKLLTVGGEGGATNALLLQRLIGPAGLKPVLARPGVRHVRLPTAALHNLQAFNLATATTVQPPDSTASPTPGPTPPELVDTRANSSPWTDRDEVKPERGSSPEGSEPWNLPSSADVHEYTYEETVRTDNMDRTVLDPIPDRYSPDMEAQRIFDKMFDVDSKKSYAVDSHDDSPRCAYDIDPSDCDDKAYQVVQKKDGSQRQHRLSHVSAAALRHKYAILEHELRLQKSLSEECEDLGVDSPSASELFPEAELLFAASPAHEHNQEHHSHTPQPLQSSIPQPDMDDQIATDHLIPREIDVSLGLGDVGIVAVSEDGSATIALDQEEFARSHPNTTFHSEPSDGEVQPFTIAGLKGRHITSTIFHSSAPATVLMTAPQATVISQAPDHSVKYEIENMINSMPGSHNNDINLSSVLVKDDGLTRFDNILTDSRELHLTNTTSAIVHSSGNATQVIRRVCYEDDKRERDARYLIDEPDNLIAGDDAKMIAEDSSRDATLGSMADADDDRSSPERHAELFWESNSASERSESRRPLDFSSDSDKCCKSPFDEANSTDSSGVGAQMRLDSVIKQARGRQRGGSADGSSAEEAPPLRTYPAKRSVSGKTRAGEREPDGAVRRRASGRGVVKRGCPCCTGEPPPPRPKKPRARKPTLDFHAAN